MALITYSHYNFHLTMSFLRTGAGTDLSLCVECPALSRSHQPRAVKPNSNELDHCPSAALGPKSKSLDGAMILPTAGEISIKILG